MFFLVKNNLRTHAKQYLATGIAIVICTCFVSATMALGNALAWVANARQEIFTYNTDLMLVKDVDIIENLDLPEADVFSQQVIQGYQANPSSYFTAEELAALNADEQQQVITAVLNYLQGNYQLNEKLPAKILNFARSINERIDNSAWRIYHAKDQIIAAIPEIKALGSFINSTLVISTENIDANKAAVNAQSKNKFKESSNLTVSEIMPEPFFRPVLKTGTYPQKADEIIVTAEIAKDLKLAVGDTILAKSPYYASAEAKKEAETNQAGQQLKLVGIIANDVTIKTGFMPAAYVAENSLNASFGSINVYRSNILVSLQKGSDISKVKQTFINYCKEHQLLGGNYAWSVLNQKEYRDAQWGKRLMMLLFINSVVSIFPIIAMFVCCTIISVTFSVILARRRREIALMRCIGAEQKQLRKAALLECVAVGLIFSSLGAGLGWLISVVLPVKLQLIGSYAKAISIYGFATLFVPIIIGSLITLAAGLRPTANIAGVSPLAALNPQQYSIAEKKLRQRGRRFFGVLFFVLGSGAWYYSWYIHKTNIDKAESLYSFPFLVIGAIFYLLCIFLVGRLILPKIACACLKLFGKNQGVSHLAAVNLMRDKQRTGATLTTLLLSIIMIGTSVIGLFSLEETVRNSVYRSKGFDFMMWSNSADDPIDESDVDKLKSLSTYEESVLAEAIPLPASIQLSDGQVIYPKKEAYSYDATDSQKSVAMANEASSNNLAIALGGYIAAFPTNINDVARTDLSNGLNLDDQSIIIVSRKEEYKNLWDKNGQTVTLNYGAEQVALKLIAKEDLESYIKDVDADFIISPKLLERLVKAKLPSFNAGVIARLQLTSDASSTYKTFENLNKLFAGTHSGYKGAYFIINYMNIILVSLRLIMMLLIGVTVLVALVGVANNLSLSVVDRAHETALLRAIGLTRKQVKKMVWLEAFMMGFTSLLLGLLISFIFAGFGLHVLPLGSTVTSNDYQLVIPYTYLFGFSLIILTCCSLAAVLPGRQASKASPIAALTNSNM